MFRKIITILIILLVVAIIVLGIAWFVARRAAVKDGREPLTFREFISLNDSPIVKPVVPDNGLSSDFTDPNQTGTSGDPNNFTGGTIGGGDNYSGSDSFNVSTFTNTTISPASMGTNTGNTIGGSGSSLGGGSSVGSGGSFGGGAIGNPQGGTGSTGSTGTGSTGTGSTTGGGNSQVVIACSEEDTNITFTPDELARLAALEKKFYALAGSLYTDSDVDNEAANYDSYRVEETQIMEMTMQCKTRGTLISNPVYARKVATPFWREAQNAELFSAPAIPASISNSDSAKPVIERLLRINFW